MSFWSRNLGFIANNVPRELDEKAAIQRKREEEAEAKLAAKKAGARMPERAAAAPMSSRTDSNEPPAGPPRLSLAGNKPTWREREAQRLAAGSPQTAPSAPPSDIATSEAQLPRKTGYVPPARRGETAVPRGRTVADSSTTRDDSPADAAPKAAPGKYVPVHLRNRG